MPETPTLVYTTPKNVARCSKMARLMEWIYLMVGAQQGFSGLIDSNIEVKLTPSMQLCLASEVTVGQLLGT